MTPFDTWHLVKKWIWWGVWALPGPPGQAKPVPARATARGRSEASRVPWNHPIPPKKIVVYRQQMDPNCRIVASNFKQQNEKV